MNPEFNKSVLSRSRPAHNLAALSDDFTQVLKSPVMQLVEEAMLDQATRQLSTRTVSINQLQQALSVHLADTTTDEISLVLLSGYMLGHEQPFDTLCTLLLHLAQPLIERTPTPALSQIDWLTSLIQKFMGPCGSSMERAQGYLTLLQQEIAPQTTRDDHSRRLFPECKAFFTKMEPLLPADALTIAIKAFARWLMSIKHTDDEIAAAYSLISCFFSPLELYDTLKHFIPCCRLKTEELGLLLTILWSKQPLDNATGVKILQTFHTLLTHLEQDSKKAVFKNELRVFYDHISRIPLIQKQTSSQANCNLQMIRELTTSITKRLEV